MYDVLGIGEILVDFSPMGTGKMGNPCFEMNPGGAPANCLAANAALGGKTAFIGMVGCDLFGDFLGNALVKAGIDATGLQRTNEAPTTLAFVSIDEKGERSFSFVRNPGADYMLTKEAMNHDLVDASEIVHFGSLTLTNEPGRTSLFELLSYAKQQGKTISYDPNYRAALWNDADKAVYWMRQALPYADIVKMSEEEMALILDIDEEAYADGAHKLLEMGKKAVFITLGAKGAYYATEKEEGFVPGFCVAAVDTTGCGDSFTGAIHYRLKHFPKAAMRDHVVFANAVGAMCSLKWGGIQAMPVMGEVSRFLKENGQDISL